MSGPPGTPVGEVSAAQLARRRRTQALQRNWALFRSSRSGLLGMVLLSFFIAVALLAPLLAGSDGLDVTQATGDILAPPSTSYPLGTDENGR
jgi:peptide/nickel transport system permease protein